MHLQKRLDDISKKAGEAELRIPELKGKLRKQKRQLAETTGKLVALQPAIGHATVIKRVFKDRLNSLDSKPGKMERGTTDMARRLVQHENSPEAPTAEVEGIRTSCHQVVTLSSGEKKRLKDRCRELEKHVQLRDSLAYRATILRELERQNINLKRVHKSFRGVTNTIQVAATQSAQSFKLSNIIVSCSTHMLIASRE